ncbi:MAG: hypothetical protein ABIT47_00865 [Candidatus Paceibacterota bacterium]
MLKTRTRIWWSTAVLLAFISVAGLCAHALGWYQEYWFADVILHTLSGGMFGLFWLGLTYKEEYKSKLIFILTITMAGVFGSYFWELWEFGGAYILPGIAIAYLPDLADTLSDIACGMCGALIVGVMYFLQTSKR